MELLSLILKNTQIQNVFRGILFQKTIFFALVR